MFNDWLALFISSPAGVFCCSIFLLCSLPVTWRRWQSSTSGNVQNNSKWRALERAISNIFRAFRSLCLFLAPQLNKIHPSHFDVIDWLWGSHHLSISSKTRSSTRTSHTSFNLCFPCLASKLHVREVWIINTSTDIHVTSWKPECSELSPINLLEYASLNASAASSSQTFQSQVQISWNYLRFETTQPNPVWYHCQSPPFLKHWLPISTHPTS